MLSIVWTITGAPLTDSTLSVAASEEFLELVKSSLLAALEGSLLSSTPSKVGQHLNRLLFFIPCLAVVFPSIDFNFISCGTSHYVSALQSTDV